MQLAVKLAHVEREREEALQVTRGMHAKYTEDMLTCVNRKPFYVFASPVVIQWALASHVVARLSLFGNYSLKRNNAIALLTGFLSPRYVQREREKFAHGTAQLIST